MKRAILGISLTALLVAAPAFAAAPLPQRAKAYSTGGYKHGISLTFVISASNPKRIEPGGAAAGSQFALSNGAVQCKAAKRAPGVPETPFAIFGFPGATLKLAHGSYAFSKTSREKGAFALGSNGPAFNLKAKISGRVISPNAIAGTVKVTGGPCTTKKAVAFTASLDPRIPVAPGL